MTTKIINIDKNVEKRFWSKVDVKSKNECWEWVAGKRRDGYGRFTIGNKEALPHRVSYKIHNGRIPKNMLILHKCDNRACVNPNHLYAGTQQDNMDDMYRKGRRQFTKRQSVRCQKQK